MSMLAKMWELERGCLLLTSCRHLAPACITGFEQKQGALHDPCSWRRYGYASSRQLSDVVDGYIYAGIPLETLVTDSQYMDNDQDFTFSKDFPVDSMQARTGSPGSPQI